jgi:DNA-directed RNA polymerase subunit H (RpoH/RPB5)
MGDISFSEQKFLRVKFGQLRMVLDRGYAIEEDEQLFYDDPTEDMFYDVYEDFESLNRLYEHPTKELLYVRYIEEVKKVYLGKEVVQLFVSEYLQKKANRGILISEQDLSQQGRQILEREGTYLQHFLIDELLIDITVGQDVSKHELLSPEESKKYIAQMSQGLVGSSVLPHQMPKIFISEAVGKTKRFSSDPQAKYLGALPGEIIRVTRLNNYSETLVPAHIIHRIVY